MLTCGAIPLPSAALMNCPHGVLEVAFTYLSPCIQRATMLSILDMRNARLLFLSDTNQLRCRLSKKANNNRSERNK
jgi:hypothetical protein